MPGRWSGRAAFHPVGFFVVIPQLFQASSGAEASDAKAAFACAVPVGVSDVVESGGTMVASVGVAEANVVTALKRVAT